MPWREPWVVRRPTNLFTRRSYCGLNELLLTEKAEGRGSTSHFRLTARQVVRRGGVWLSMASASGAYGNAMCESFFATLEGDLLQ